MQSYFVNYRLIKLNLLVLTVNALILQKYLLFKYQITIRHLIEQAVCLNWRYIIKILTWLLINLVIVYTNIREDLFESTIIKSCSLYISLEFIEVIVNVRALWWDLFCWNNVGDEVFVLKPVLDLVVRVAVGSIIT